MGKLGRLIRYNFKTDTGEQTRCRYRWTFFILNEPREINRIRERIFQTLKPVDELNDIDDVAIPNSRGLHYHIFSFSTDKAQINGLENIYSSEDFKKDRDLWERDSGKYGKYLERILKEAKKD